MTVDACRHHPGEDCGCYCRFVGCSPEMCPEDEVLVRLATDEEQREALERGMEAMGLRGMILPSGDVRVVASVSEPVTGTTVTFRDASEAPKGTASTLVLSRSGQSIERIVGERPAGWGYVVRARGVALEVIVRRVGREARGPLGFTVTRQPWTPFTLVHRRVAWSGEEAAKDNGIEEHCDLVGGACESHGPGWQFYALVEKAFENMDSTAPTGELWAVLEAELETWLR